MLLHTLIVLCMIGALSASDRTCEPIRIETCQGIGYNVTGMPNLVGHELQQDAELQLQTFTPLIQYGCSSRLKFFLCSVYVPMCTEKVPDPIGPCRSLCEDIRDRCQPVLQEFGFPWPPGLNCSKFPPQNNNKHMCMEGPAHQKGSEQTNLRIRNRNRRPNLIRNNDVTFPHRKIAIKNAHSQHYGLCKNLRHSEQYYYINRTKRCAPLCSANINFDENNKVIADYWLAGLATTCFLCTLFNISVVMIGEYRFRYPDGAIIFISACYNACSIAYLIRIFNGRMESSCLPDAQHNVQILIQEGLDNMTCTVISVILYFFRMSCTGWWVILCATWYLSSWKKFNSETLLKYSSFYHLLAWGIPCAMTITVLVMRVIDADELIGNCYVGNQNSDNHLYYVIVPSILYLAIGGTVLTMVLFATKNDVKDYSQVQPTVFPRPSESLASGSKSIGIFISIFLVVALCVLGLDIYEYVNHDLWLVDGSQDRPLVELFLFKFVMLQIMGIGTIFVIGSSDATNLAFKNLSHCIMRKKKPVPSYLQVQPQLLTTSCHSKRSISSRAQSETIL